MLKYLLKTSRPRFWIYLLGPYLIGTLAAVGTKNLTSLDFWVWFLYFLIPANFLIYGVNDLADTDTDEFNQKKEKYEVKFDRKKLKLFIGIFLITNIPFLLSIKTNAGLYSLLLFWFLGIFYSLNPIRAKAKLFLDSLFNVLYLMPAVFAYLNFGTEKLNFIYVLSAAFWCMAMHTYSAIPDISADKKANLKTTATALGIKGASIYCAVLYVLAGIFSGFWLLSIPYFALTLLSYKNNSEQYSFKIYKYFPYLNAFIGFIILYTIYLNL